MLELDDLLPDAPFRERHKRVVELPIDVVWEATQVVQAADIRLFGPLMALRHIPHLVAGREQPLDAAQPVETAQPPEPEPERSFFEQFEEAGFTVFHRDAAPVDGRALIVAGAAGRFWRPVGNTPVSLADREDFVGCVEPDLAKTVFSMEAIDLGGRTELVTETRVDGTDSSSTRKFGLYWGVIRGPSGLIRRSWLAAIDRKAHELRQASSAVPAS